MKPALILTLEPTIVSPRSNRGQSVHSLDWKFRENILEIIKDYADKKYKILIVSNQLAIWNELITEKEFIKKMNAIVNKLEEVLKLPANSICYDYEVDINSYRFLPKPGMLLEFALDHEIDFHDSVVIGNGIYERSIAFYIGASYKDITLI